MKDNLTMTTVLLNINIIATKQDNDSVKIMVKDFLNNHVSQSFVSIENWKQGIEHELHELETGDNNHEHV
jgi:hypothetical protein